VAMIVAWVQEIVESFRELAKLLREGKLNLQPAAPRQRTSRPTGNPTERSKRPTRSPRLPQPAAATAQVRVSPADPEMGVRQAPAPERTPRPPWVPRIQRPATQAPPHWPPIPKNGPHQARPLARP
jgi:hypothetical protein